MECAYRELNMDGVPLASLDLGRHCVADASQEVTIPNPVYCAEK